MDFRSVLLFICTMYVVGEKNSHLEEYRKKKSKISDGSVK